MWILIKEKIFHLQLQFIYWAEMPFLSKYSLTKTGNNVKSVLSICILNGYYLHHSCCNLCNSPIGNFLYVGKNSREREPVTSLGNLFQCYTGSWNKKGFPYVLSEVTKQQNNCYPLLYNLSLPWKSFVCFRLSLNHSVASVRLSKPSSTRLC